MSSTRNVFAVVRAMCLGCVVLALLKGCVARDPAADLEQAEQRFAAGDYATAAILVQNVLQVDVDNIGARVLLGRLGLVAGDMAQARLQLEAARDLGAAPESFAIPLAAALLELNEAAAALSQLDMVSADAGGADYWLVRGRALIVTGQFAEAADAFDEAAALAGETAPLLIERARATAVQGDSAAAEALLTRALAIDAANAEALALRGLLALTVGALEKGEPDLRAAAEIYESRGQVGLAAPVLLRLVQVQLALNDLDAATTTARRLSSAIPNGAFADYANGLVAFQRGDFDETVELLRIALTKAPDQPQLMALLGAAHLAVGNYGQAEQQFLSILRQNAADPAAVRLLAETRIRQQRPQAALEALELFQLTGTEADAGILLLQGAARMQSGNFEAAIPYLEQARAVDPSGQAVVVRLLQAYVATGRTAEAEFLLRNSPALTLDEAYSAKVAVLLTTLQRDGNDAGRAYVDRLVTEGPRDPYPLLLRATFYELTNDRNAARQSLDAALALDAAFVPARLAKAAILTEERRPGDAERELLEVVRLQPGNITALMSLAQLAAQRGDYPAAERHLLQAADNTKAALPRVALSRLALVSGDIASAEKHVSEARNLEPASLDVLVTRGMIALAKSDAAEAVALLRDAWERIPNRPSVALLLAEAEVAAGNPRAGRDTLLAAVAAMPETPDLRAALGAVELGLGNAAEALRIATELQVDSAQQPAGYALEARVRMAERRYGDAARMYRLAYERNRSWDYLASVVAAARLSNASVGEQALVEEWLAGAPGDVRARLLLAELLELSGRVDEALAEYVRIIELDPDNVAALNNAAWYSHLQSRPQALDYAKRAAELAPENAAVLDTLGWILTQTNRAGEAIEHLRRATQLAPQAVEIRYHLAVAQVQLGQTGAARETLTALLREDRPFELRGAAQDLLETL